MSRNLRYSGSRFAFRKAAFTRPIASILVASSFMVAALLSPTTATADLVQTMNYVAGERFRTIAGTIIHYRDFDIVSSDKVRFCLTNRTKRRKAILWLDLSRVYLPLEGHEPLVAPAQTETNCHDFPARGRVQWMFVDGNRSAKPSGMTLDGSGGQLILFDWTRDYLLPKQKETLCIEVVCSRYTDIAKGNMEPGGSIGEGFITSVRAKQCIDRCGTLSRMNGDQWMDP